MSSHKPTLPPTTRQREAAEKLGIRLPSRVEHDTMGSAIVALEWREEPYSRQAKVAACEALGIKPGAKVRVRIGCGPEEVLTVKSIAKTGAVSFVGRKGRFHHGAVIEVVSE